MPHLRPYTHADFDQVINLFLLNTPQYFCPPEQQDLEAFLNEEIEHYFVIEQDGIIVASGGCNIEDSIGWLSWYIVHPEHHKKGLGAMLVRRNLDILQSHTELNKTAVHTSQLVYPFYEKHGFTLTGSTDNYWGPGMHLYEMELLRNS